MNKPRLWHTESLEEALQITDVTKGLSDEEIVQSKALYGLNQLEEGKKKSFFQRFIDQFKDTMIIILLVAATISFFLGESVDSIIILTIVVLNAVLGLVQEGKAEQALEALKAMSAPSAKVIRNSVECTVLAKEVLPFDILILEAGDLVAADIRLLKTASLQIQEASLTGESVPVDKSADWISEEESSLGDRRNMAYASSMVTYGRGYGLVVGTGMNTEVGKIAHLLSSSEQEDTPLQISVNKLGKTLGYAALGAVIVIFIIGLLYQRDPLDMFLTAVSLAVAIIPESLPAVATIVLAMGVQRLAKRKAIIRKLSSVETLGSATVICSDKTGTLTQNKMTVKEHYTLDEASKNQLVSGSRLCTDARKLNDVWVGDPTETALSEWADLKDNQTLGQSLKRVAEVPFDSGRKLMTTIHELGSKWIAYTKGGLDEVLNQSTHILKEGKVVKIGDEDIKRIQIENTRMSKKALRVLAFAYRPLNELVKDGDLSVESQLIFVGLIGMMDPPREEVKVAIATCKKAGIHVVMITGDHKLTAEAIGQEIGLMEEGLGVLTGVELDRMSDDELYDQVEGIGVYARVSPTHKLRIIEAWRKHGDIVAMTGDGVNDAPALKKADIGASMGIVGTEVAKGASDMILADDNFATVVHAVEEGRRIKANILKAISYLLSCNVGELFTLLIATLLNWAAPLLPIHILWINLVTDSLPALALGIDPAEPKLMEQKPNRDLGLLNKSMLLRILYQGIMIGGLTIFAFMYGSGWLGEAGDIKTGQTMAFTVLAFSQLVHSFNIRSAKHSVLPRLFENRSLWLAVIINGLMMAAVLFVPALRDLFKLAELDLHHWEIVAMLVFLPLPIVELMKLFKLNGK